MRRYFIDIDDREVSFGDNDWRIPINMYRISDVNELHMSYDVGHLITIF